MNHTRTNRNGTTRHAWRQGRQFRGNTIVLVAGILVLLVIIATSYLTRTQSQRVVSVATAEWHNMDANAGVIADKIAEELALQLFVWPIDPEIYADCLSTQGTPAKARDCVMNANLPRLHPTMYSQVHFDINGDPIPARRYNVDHSPGGHWFSFNFAPYHTVPWTNWPDPLSFGPGDPWNDPTIWPAGPGNLADNAGNAFSFGLGGKALAFSQSLLASEYNPLGNPGFGDNRLLADIEPMRYLYEAGTIKGAEVFTFWRKLTNLAHSNNSWRIVADLSDVDANIVHNLNIPVEQWLSARPFNVSTGATGSPHVAGNTNILTAPPSLGPPNSFVDLWQQWFGLSTLRTYTDMYARPVLATPTLAVPANFINLRNPNASATFHEPLPVGERPQDEFVPGTLRHTVSRVLADTTGDGFTDSFWFLAPVPSRNGIRTIAAVRIVDNSALVNANVATRFFRNDADPTCGELLFGDLALDTRKTRGDTPADIALVGQAHQTFPLGPANIEHFAVGLYDNPANAYVVPGAGSNHAYLSSYWRRHLSEVGLPVCNTLGFNNAKALNDMLSRHDRRDYWRLSGRMGLATPSPLPDSPFYSGGDTLYRPFSLADEVELRMFHGNNYPWIFSRYEWSTQNTGEEASKAFLRAGSKGGGAIFNPYQESSEYVDQLTNIQLVQDNRRKITLYSGARNDLMPPWLWWENRRDELPELVENYIDNASPPDWVEYLVRTRASDQSRQRLDLREMRHLYYEDLIPNPTLIEPDYDDVTQDAGRLNFRERLADTLLLALTDSGDDMESAEAWNRFYGSYFGRYVSEDPSNPGVVDPTVEYSLEEWDPVIGGLPMQPLPRFDHIHGPLNNTRRMAAAWASNILGYRTNKPASLDESIVEVPKFADLAQGVVASDPLNPTPPRTGYLPIDPQPFLVEVFIGHVYKSSTEAPGGYIDPLTPGYDPLLHECDTALWDAEGFEWSSYLNGGSDIIFDSDEHRSTIVVVQIANPFDVPIDLREYRIRVLGKDGAGSEFYNVVSLADLFTTLGVTNTWLEPARNDRPTTAIFYAIKDELFDDQPGSLRERWLDFLDIRLAGNTLPGDPHRAGNNHPTLAPGTLVVDFGAGASTPNRVQVWTREPYDDPADSGQDRRTVSLERQDLSLPGAVGPEWLTVDRIDPPHELSASTQIRSFRDAVREMGEYRPMADPEDGASLRCHVPPDINGYYPTYEVESPDHHWVQWVRAARAWGVDLNGNGVYEAHERSPRYVFGDRAVIVPSWNGTPEADDPTQPGEPLRFSRQRRLVAASNPEMNGPWETDDDVAGANMYQFNLPPNNIGVDSLNNEKPWFARTYYNTYGDLVDGETLTSGRTPKVLPTEYLPQRKPTFFALGWKEGQWANPPYNNSNHAARAYFMPDQGWYGQFKIDLRNPSASAAGISPSEFKTVGVGWGRPGGDATGTPTSGVDDPTILFQDGATQTKFRDSALIMNWVTSAGADAPPLPLFRQPYSMQMTLKNKLHQDQFDFSNLPPWFPPNSEPAQQAELLRSRDFEQVGELLNVWLFGHEIEYTLDSTTGKPVPDTVDVTVTFAEHMSRARREDSSAAPYLWTLTGGTPDFDVPLDLGGGVVRTPYQRYLDWLADSEKNRVNRVRLTPWEFRAYPTKAATDNAQPTDEVDLVFGDVVGRPRVAVTTLPDPASELLYLNDPRHGVPALPAGVRVLDAFVCDGPGDVRWVGPPMENWVDSLGDEIGFEGVERRRFYNANGFNGRSTPGLINVNTAPLEVLRTLPHMTRMVHEISSAKTGAPFQLVDNPFPEVPRALIRYRERFGDPNPPAVFPIGYGAAPDSFNINHGPAYAHRGRDRDWFLPAGTAPPVGSFDEVPALLRNMRGDRGMASIGELTLLTQSGRVGKDFDSPGLYLYNDSTGVAVDNVFRAVDFNSSWRIDFASMPDRVAFEVDNAAVATDAQKEVYLFGTTDTGPLPPDHTLSGAQRKVSTSARISTDVVEVVDVVDHAQNPGKWTSATGEYFGYAPPLRPDDVAEDAQESNLLFAGLSNLITTRSDTFTVYFRIRSFRQNPVTGKWDATDPDYIVDDSRYVMLVDRSNVNKPTDKPKILYLEKLPK